MTKNLMDFGTNFGRILEPFWPNFGSLGGPTGSIFGAKIEPWAKTLPKMGPKSSQEPLFWPPAYMEAQRHAKVPPRPPKALIFEDFGTPKGLFP